VKCRLIPRYKFVDSWKAKMHENHKNGQGKQSKAHQ
jgi:hypothetical protein